jgi:hydroxypyruvate isomerase
MHNSIGVCIEMFFPGLSSAEKVKKVASLGYKRYEFWGPRERDGKPKDFDALAELNRRLGLTVTGMLYCPEDERGAANMSRREDRAKLVDKFGEFVSLARKMDCKALIITGGDLVPGQNFETSLLNLYGNLSALAAEAGKNGLTLLLETLNSKVDHPNTFLDSAQRGVDIIKALAGANVKLLYDVYHAQIMGGGILAFVKENLEWIGHFHLAGVPGRHELYAGELDYARIVKEISAMGYRGAFGLEYRPGEDGETSLSKTLEYLSR